MNIIVAEHSGFCYGARRIVDLANENGRAYSLGPVLHNEQLIERLKEKGIEPLTLDEILGKGKGRVIIRAHGVPAQDIEKLREKGFQIIDGTCPKVQEIYCITAQYEKDGYQIFIFGDKEHPEVIGIASRLSNPFVVKTADDVPDKHYEKICMVSQTTQIPSNYENLKKLLSSRCDKFESFDTICPATNARQQSASSLAKEVDVMLVVGGKESSNTKKLYSVCEEANISTHLIQTEKDLDRSWFSGADIVGIAAGASTPDFVIESIAEELRKY